MLEGVSKPVDLAQRLAELTAPVAELHDGLLVSATYDKEKRVAVLKFYDSKNERICLWEDTTQHRPYCYAKLPRESLTGIESREDIVDIQEELKLDLLSDSPIMVSKIVASDPLAIGGAPGRSIRDMIEVWEADIKYYENYLYDKRLQMGTYYEIARNKLRHLSKEVPDAVKRSLDSILMKASAEAVPFIRTWAELLGQPLSTFKSIACDIEVENEEGRVPDPEIADRRIIAVSFHNDRESVVYLLAKGDDEQALSTGPFAGRVALFRDEASLLRAVFTKILEYPFLITFNGDDFDLPYLKRRAEKRELGIREEEIPIALLRQEASLKHGVHIDLYRFFNNRSIQVYVYSNRYSEHTLDAISDALLGRSKVPFEGNIGELPLVKLAEYSLTDAELTYQLTSDKDFLLMKILLVISRIAKMPVNDVARIGVSNWIRSMLFYEHRKKGALIPRADELAKKGGASSEAIIRGKKYKGGLVIEPKPGIHFGISVLDFASLYPSIIKVHNLSYETVNCSHEECRTNKVPDTDHWVCKRRSGITSLVTGSLRDLRVNHYKHLTRDQNLSKADRDLFSTVSQGLKVILNACFTGDTNIVTPDGIRSIRDMTVGDRVINVNRETLQIEIDRVVEVQRFPYRGNMYHFNDKRFVDLKVTPNHRFLVRDKRVGSTTGTVFRTAEEIFNSTNMAIPKLRGGINDLSSSPKVSLLHTASKMGAFANIYPGEGRRLSSWFTKLPQPLRSKIRQSGSVNKNRSKLVEALRSHYRIPASVMTEGDIDEVEKEGGFVLLGERRASKMPARCDSADFASLCGWFVSEGNLIATEPRFYPNEGHRGSSSGIVITQSYGKGNAMGLPYRAEIARLLDGLGLRHITDSGDKKYFQVSNSILHRWMLDNCYVAGAPKYNAVSKRIPDFVFSSRRTLESFFEACYKGDGSHRDKRYSTSSLRLANDMIVLLSLLGAKSKMTYEPKNGVYRVIFKNVSAKLTSAGSRWHRFVKRSTYEGEVYCVTTERNHTVIAGRNGRFVHVGQSYGVMGFETFALYCLPVAEATAAYGREAITKTIEKCKAEGIPVIYSDTDSLFIEHPAKDKIVEVVRWAESELGVELSVDKVYRYVAFSERKKNYFGVLEDGTPDIKGLTGKKSQTPEFLKRVFYDTLRILGNVYGQADFDQARSSIKELLTERMRRLRNYEIPVPELAFNVMMGKSIDGYKIRKDNGKPKRGGGQKPSETVAQTSLASGSTVESPTSLPQHVRAAKQLQDRGKEIKAGDIISYVKTTTPGGVKPVEFAKQEEIDIDKYVEYARSMFDQILDAMGVTFDEIVGRTNLDLFWSGAP